MARTRVGLFLTKEEETKLEEWCQERTTSTRYGETAVEGLRVDTRDLARHADSLRSMAGSGTRRSNKGREFRLGPKCPLDRAKVTSGHHYSALFAPRYSRNARAV